MTTNERGVEWLEAIWRGFHTSFMGGTELIGLEIAKEHRTKLNPHSQWIEQDQVRDPGAKTKLSEEHARYKEWGARNQVWRGGKPETLDEFEKAMVNLKFKVAAPTSHKKGRAMWVHGLRPKEASDYDSEMGDE